MKRVIVLYGEGFTDEDITKAKNILDKAFEDWDDTFILLTNKQVTAKKINDSAWEKMEKDFEES